MLEKDRIFDKWLGKLDIHKKKIEVHSHFEILCRLRDRIKDLNIRHEIFKLLQVNIAKTLEDLGNTFLNKTPIVQKIKELTNGIESN
jgi:hypothetical protein